MPYDGFVPHSSHRSLAAPVLSIVVPAYNESAGIQTFHETLLLPALAAVTERLAERSMGADPYEIIYVNDGSTDNTLEKLQELAQGSTTTRVVNLSRNFGKEIATTAGIEVALGQAVLIMDADGQHPPAYISDFLSRWEAGAQVVVGVRSNDAGGFFKTQGSRFFYRIFNSISESQTVPRSTDFRLLDRVVVDEFLRFSERNRITRGLIDWLGFKRDYIEFEAPDRLAGEATYSMRKLVGLALNSFTTMSIKPLFAFGYLGLFITLLALIAGLTIIVQQFLMGDPLGWDITGSAMVGILVAFLVGVLLVAQGMLAIYLSHIYVQAQGRPLYVIDRTSSRNLIG